MKAYLLYMKKGVSSVDGKVIKKMAIINWEAL